MPYIKSCGYGTEWLGVMLCAQKYQERVPKRTNTNPDDNTNPDPKPTPKSNHNPNVPNILFNRNSVATYRFLINNRRHINAELWTLLQHKRAQCRSIYLGHMSVV